MTKFFPSLLLLCLLAIPLMSQDILEVTTTTPSPGDPTFQITLPGRTEAVEYATLFTRATGTVAERKADIGDLVKKGDILAIIAVPDLDRAIDAAKAAVAQAKAEEDNARAMAVRSEKLLSTSAISAEEAERRQNDLVAKSAARQVVTAQLAKLETERDFAIVRAPFNGIITERNFDIGNHVRGDASGRDEWLYRIARSDTLLFVIASPPSLATRCDKSTRARILFPAFSESPVEAMFSRSSRSFDPATGTMRAEFLIDNADLRLPIGLTGKATITLPPSKHTFYVPSNTIIVNQGVPQIILDHQGKARFIDVIQGARRSNETEVKSTDLEADSRVVVNPNALIQPGTMLKSTMSDKADVN